LLVTCYLNTFGKFLKKKKKKESNDSTSKADNTQHNDAYQCQRMQTHVNIATI